MKKILKFLNAALFLAAFGVSFVELARLAVVNATLIDLIKLGFGKASGSAFAREMIDMVQEEVKPLAMLAAILVVLMWLGVILSVLLRRNLPYISGMILALIQAAGVTGIYFGIDSKLEVFREGLDFFGMGSRVKMYSYTLIMWLVIYGLIILFSVIGIALKEKQKSQEHGPIMPEQFNPRKNPLENRGAEQALYAKPGRPAAQQGVSEQKPQQPAAQQRVPEQKPQQPAAQQRVPEQKAQQPAAQQRVPEQKAQQPAAQQRVPEQKPQQPAAQQRMPEQKPQQPAAQQRVPEQKPQQKENEKTFTGAIVGLTGEYASKAYILQEKQQVFFEQEEGKICLSDKSGVRTIAAVYYIEEYKEYCVEVRETKSFFLKSGQPLGKGRIYYLPRGTEIYITAKENRFTLA